MSRKQRRLVEWWEKSGRWIWSAGLAAMVMGFEVSACGQADSAFSRCIESEDCNNLPGTTCTKEKCMCTAAAHQFCNGACRPIAECLPGTGGGGAGGIGGGGGGAGIQCNTAAECPQPGDPHCGRATCEDGACHLQLAPLEKISSQIRGDCKHLWCDGAGNLVEIEDGSDAFNDGAQCTIDICEAGNPITVFAAEGGTCPETGVGLCYQGDCVLCIDGMGGLCGGGLACDGFLCVPMHCVNNTWDPASGETAFNCGGPCRPCQPSSACNKPSDCFHNVCTGNSCALPTCSDGVRNDSETGTDCGGPASCSRCDVGQGCKAPSDCLSGVCWAGICEAPSCTDGIKNGDESDWDCGGSCAPCPG